MQCYQSVSLLGDFMTRQSRVVSWDEVLNLLTGPALKERTLRYRTDKQWRWKSSMPCIIPAALLNGKGKTEADVVSLTGITMVDLDHLPKERIEEIRQLVNDDPHTMLSYVTVSGEGLRICCRYRMPELETDPVKLYATAFLTANCHYADLTGFAFDEKCGNINRLSALCHDPDAFFRKDAACFDPEKRREELERAAMEETAKPVAQEESPLDYAVRVVEKHGERYFEGNRHNYLMKCLMMMNKLGVAQTEAERWALQHDLGEREIRQLAGNIYTRYAHEHGSFSMPQIFQSFFHSEAPHTHTRARVHTRGCHSTAGRTSCNRWWTAGKLPSSRM